MSGNYPFGREPKQSNYGQLNATQLYCPTCGQATPVRSRLLLVLPEGDKYEYLCAYCGTSVGEKIDKSAPQVKVLV